MKGKVFQAPTDTEGYAYKISMCTEIPNAQLPSGCQQYAEHPSVVKYKANNPADCIEIGSIGPCTQVRGWCCPCELQLTGFSTQTTPGPPRGVMTVRSSFTPRASAV
jgi:hypothetical protein